MAKNTFMLLAHVYKDEAIGGWFMSEKLDGQRCYWDGGISRGLIKSSVPWANTGKDARYQVPPVATGLWSRYGNVIHAPDSWLDSLPPYPLDGELMHPAGRQTMRSVVSKLVGDEDDWSSISYHVFDSPPLPFDGVVKLTNFKKDITGCDAFIGERRHQLCFMDTYGKLPTEGVVVAHPQERLPMVTSQAMERALSYLDSVTSNGGEGIMLRDSFSFWKPERSHGLLKMKKLDDAEGVVTGYITGRRTDKGSKLLGLMGALVLELDNGARLELSGFTDAERALGYTNSDPVVTDAHTWASDHPETEVPSCYQAKYFPRGSRVTFHYRGLTDAGIPNEARYFRKWEAV